MVSDMVLDFSCCNDKERNAFDDLNSIFSTLFELGGYIVVR